MHQPAFSRLRLVLLALVLAALLGALLGLPAAPAEAQDPPPDELRVLLLAPLVKIYVGDTISIPYFTEHVPPQGGIPLAPLTPADTTIQASLGSASVVSDNIGGAITYQAEKSGQESLTLFVQNPLGSGTGSLDFTVYPEPNYTLDFYITSQATDEGAGFRALFSGSGEFSHTEDTPVNGKGEADYWFALWAITQPFQCLMSPPVQSHAAFQIVNSNIPPVAPLIRPPNFIHPISLSLQFQPMSLNASTIECAGLGDITASFPWPAQVANADEYGLQDLQFPGEGGILPYTNTKTEGLIIVTRKEP
jgi:hypothetical protein